MSPVIVDRVRQTATPTVIPPGYGSGEGTELLFGPAATGRRKPGEAMRILFRMSLGVISGFAALAIMLQALTAPAKSCNAIK